MNENEILDFENDSPNKNDLQFKLGAIILIFTLLASFVCVYLSGFYITCGFNFLDVMIQSLPNVIIILSYYFFLERLKKWYWILILVGLTWNVLSCFMVFYVVC